MSIKVTVLKGPSKGASYNLNEGENFIGRSEDNNICLASSQVSKRHAIINIANRKVELIDAGSSNGTFVNGILVKKKELKPKDKIAIGPFLLQVMADASAAAGAGMRLPPGMGAGGPGGMPAAGMPDMQMGAPMGGDPMAAGGMSGDLAAGNFGGEVGAGGGAAAAPVAEPEKPKSLFAKYKKKFDEVVLPVVYEFLEKYEWSSVVAGIMGVYMLMFIGFAIYPVLQSSQESIIKESERKAKFILDQIVKQNTVPIIEGRETALTVELAEDDGDVQEAVITNTDGRILAPLRRLNAIYDNPYATRHRNRIKRGGETQWRRHVTRTEDYFVMTQPVMIGSKKQPGRNVPGALATIRYSIKRTEINFNVVGAIFGEFVFIALLLGVMAMYIVVQVTRQPFHVLNDDIDQVLKGNSSEVPKRFMFPMLDELIDTINAALSRIPQEAGEQGEVVSASETEAQIIDNMFSTIKNMSRVSVYGMMILDADQRIQTINPILEEITGIHEAEALGDVVANVSRDDAFPSLIADLVNSAAAMGDEGASEDYEFNSGLHKVHCYAVQTLPGQNEYFIIYTEKVDFDD